MQDYHRNSGQNDALSMQEGQSLCDRLNSKLLQHIPSSVKYAGLAALTAGTIGAVVAVSNMGCMDKSDQIVDVDNCPPGAKRDTVYLRDTVVIRDTANIVDTLYAFRDRLPKDTTLCIDTLAFDLCVDVNFRPYYVPNSWPGIREIIFEKVPDDDCGYISAPEGGIIGRVEAWFVREIVGNSPADDEAVNNLKEQIGNDLIINKVWLRDVVGNYGSIIYNTPYSATRVEVELDARPLAYAGIGWYVRNGVVDVEVSAYGQTRKASQTTHQVIDIANPTLMPYEIPLQLDKDKWGPVVYLTKAQWDSILAIDQGHGGIKHNKNLRQKNYPHWRNTDASGKPREFLAPTRKFNQGRIPQKNPRR